MIREGYSASDLVLSLWRRLLILEPKRESLVVGASVLVLVLQEVDDDMCENVADMPRPVEGKLVEGSAFE